MSAHLQGEELSGHKENSFKSMTAHTRHHAAGARPLSIANVSYTSRIKSKGVHRFSCVY